MDHASRDLVQHRSNAIAALLSIALLAIGSSACGVSERSKADHDQPTASTPAADFEWPSGERSVAVLRVKGMGDVRIALYPELAPKTVENFALLARHDFYEGTTFHRVVPGFAIQGGSPTSRDDDPRNDSLGGPGYTIPDEFSDAPHLRGVVAMSNSGKPNTGGSQFFIVHQDRRDLDGRYSVFGRVIEGMDVIDAVSRVEIDKAGRWGPADRPIEDIVIEGIWIESGAQARSQGEPEAEQQPAS